MSEVAPPLPEADAPPAKPSTPWLKPVLIVVKFAVSGVLLWYLIARHAPGADQFAKVNLGWVAAGVLALAAQPALNAQRWRLILADQGGNAPFKSVFAIYYAALFFMQILPSVGGDVARVLYHKRLGVRASGVVLSVLIDRGLALVSLLVAMILVLPFTIQVAPPGVGVVLAAIAAAGLGGALAFALALPRLETLSVWRALPERVRALGAAIRWSLISKTALTRLLPLSLIVHTLSSLAIYFAARSVGLENAAPLAIAVGPVMLLAQALPVSVGGWGMREMAAVLLLQGANVDPGSVVVLSVVFGLCSLAMALPGALAWLSLKN